MPTKDMISDLIADTVGRLIAYGLPAFMVGVLLLLVAKGLGF